MSRDEMRLGQVITTFGPGSMVDLPDGSAMIAGLDQWNYAHGDVRLVKEPRLERKLREITGNPALYLRTPPVAKDDDHGFRPNITAYTFPEFFVAQSSVLNREGHKRRPLVALSALDHGKYRDPGGSRVPAVPVRFVRACERGHIDDIDWHAFVHPDGSHLTHPLWLEERGTSGSIDEIFVCCDCGASRAMSDAVHGYALGFCRGRRPWLGPNTREACDKRSKLLIRTASNSYFAQLLSVISIPETEAVVDRMVAELWENFLVDDVHSMDELARVRRKPMVAARLDGFSNDEVMDAVVRKRQGGPGHGLSVKAAEFDALSRAEAEIGTDVPDGDFFARTLPKNVWEGSPMQDVQRVVLAHRLREVVAQVGFTRFEAASPNLSGDLDLGVERAPLAIDAGWLPAGENRGEGVFILFDPDRIHEWVARAAVRGRAGTLDAGFNIWKRQHSQSHREYPGAPYIMLHSLSHLLMTSISLECGYPGSSLRERLYAGPGQYGILVYTASSDAEGTLGGLVETGRDIRRHLERALDLGRLCSNDPVCAFHAPSATDPEPLLGSACHGCLLVPETSCEQHNNYLDRALVVRTVQALDAEFFGET